MIRIALLAAALATACSRPSYYKTASSDEQKCCQKLAAHDARQTCLDEIPRVDPSLESSSTNQDTFECVARHFQCDVKTGRASKDSAQAQLDCLQALR